MPPGVGRSRIPATSRRSRRARAALSCASHRRREALARTCRRSGGIGERIGPERLGVVPGHLHHGSGRRGPTQPPSALHHLAPDRRGSGPRAALLGCASIAHKEDCRMKRLADLTKTTLIGGLLVVLPIYLSILLLAKTLSAIVKLMSPVTAAIPAGTQFRQLIAILIVIAFCFVAGIAVRTRRG